MLFFVIFLVGIVTSEVLYGLGSSDLQLDKIDSTNVEMTPVGQGFSELVGAQLASLDSKNKIFYTISYNVTSQHSYLSGLHLENGNLKYHIELPFKESAFIGVGQTIQVKSGTDDVFVVGEESDNQHHIYEVNPPSGKVEKIATIGDIDVLGGASAYNPDNKLLYIQYGVGSEIDIFGWNVDTGKQDVQVVNTANMETMTYDSTTTLVYGIGLKVQGNETVRTLITFDPKHQFGEIAEISGYFIIDGSLATIDEKKRLLFAILQPEGASTSDPMQLLAIDMKSGAIKTNPDCYMSGTETPQCPWSLEKENEK